MVTFECGICGTTVTAPEPISVFRFPEDIEPIVDLLAGRFNVVQCHVCETPTSLVGPVIAINVPERLAVAVGAEPDQEDALVRVIAETLPGAYQVSVVTGYEDLHAVVVKWVRQHTQPVFDAISSKAIFDLPDEDNLALVTPLFLAALALSAEGFLPLAIGRRRELADADRRRVAMELLAASVRDQLARIVRVLAGRGVLAEAYEEAASRIPAACLTEEVLQFAAEKCPDLVDPLDKGPKFVAGFRAHLANAIAHALAGQRNPRGPTWAVYVSLVRVLRDRSDTFVDPQLLLSPTLLHRTLAFEDLWNALMPATVHPSSQPDPERALERATELIVDCGFEAELIEAMRLPFVFSLPREPAHGDAARRLVETIEEKLLKLWATGAEADHGVATPLFVQMLQAGAAQETVEMIERLVHRSHEQGDATAALAIAGSGIEALNSFERFSDAEKILKQAMPDTTAPGVSGRVLTSFLNKAGNVMRYRRDNETALRFYRLSARANELSGGPGRELRSRILRRNTAIVLRQQRDYSAALREFEALLAESPEDADVLASLAALYLEVNSPADAMSAIGAALGQPGRFGRLVRLNLLMMRGWAHHLVGDDDAAAQDLALSWADTSAGAIAMRARLASAAMQLRPRHENGTLFVAECEQHLAAVLDGGDDVDSVTAAHSARGARHQASGGRAIKAAGILAERNSDLIAALAARRPWQLDLFLGWQRFESGAGQECWPFLDEAVRAVDARVPLGDSADFSLHWMEDKLLLQRTVTTIALALVDAGELPAAELVRIFELSNGREIAARIGGDEGQSARSEAEISPATPPWRPARKSQSRSFSSSTGQATSASATSRSTAESLRCTLKACGWTRMKSGQSMSAPSPPWRPQTRWT